jgi:hypothetical protein
MFSHLTVVVPPTSVEIWGAADGGGEYSVLAEEERDGEWESGWEGGERDNVLVPLLDDHEPGCCGGMCPGESCERCGNFCFFFTMCTASLIATMATTALCVADTVGGLSRLQCSCERCEKQQRCCWFCQNKTNPPP